MYGDPIGARSTFQDLEEAEAAGASIFFYACRQGRVGDKLSLHVLPRKLGNRMVIHMEDFLRPHGLMMRIQVFHPAVGLTERGASPVFCAVFAAPLSLASRKVQS